MKHAGRKRRVTTCVPCYTRKQRCNRQYPCNNCARRRRPEECVYNATPMGLSSHAQQEPWAERWAQENAPTTLHEDNISSVAPNQAPAGGSQYSALAKSFGYFDDSNSNTMALLRSLNGEGDVDVSDRGGSAYIFEMIQPNLEQMPQRQVLDFLVQYFVSDLNWMKQIIHAPSFLTHYQAWWTKDRPLPVGDIEFAVLILRICSYSVQFLPSPSHPIDGIYGIPLSDICNTCSDIGNSLAKACLALDWKGSLVRVQHILFAALKFSCEGRQDRFWEELGCASRAAQKAGMHVGGSIVKDDGTHELEKEIRRRTFCSLYVLDSHLSRQLDRVPFLPDNLVEETLPRLRLAPDIGIDTNANSPESFTERLMQVQLGRFWRSFGSRRNSEYNPTQGEQRYERFCTEYLSILPPALALDPDTKWDEHLPKLSMQRQLLHIAIFDSVCWNFRPLLLLKPNQTASLAPYKRVLLQSQKKRIGLAVLKELEAVSALHSMFGGSHTRFSAIIFNTFEAAVLLLCLCSHADFPFDQGEYSSDILGLKVGRLTRAKSMQAVEKALGRLQVLAEVSDMAASGARVVSQLFVKASREDHREPEPAEPSRSSPWPNTFSNLLGVDWEQSNPNLVTELLSNMVQEDPYSVRHLDYTPWIDDTQPQ